MKLNDIISKSDIVINQRVRLDDRRKKINHAAEKVTFRIIL
jgi:hypothetical protein